MTRYLMIFTFLISSLVLGAALASPGHADHDHGSIGAPDALAGPDAPSARMAAMENNAAAMKAVVPMIKGEAAYDPARAELSMRILNNSAHGFDSLFPEGSEGGKTTAAPAIWKKRGKFEAAVAKFAADSSAAVAAAPKGLDAFKSAFSKVASNCGSCHQDFRIKK